MSLGSESKYAEHVAGIQGEGEGQRTAEEWAEDD